MRLLTRYVLLRYLVHLVFTCAVMVGLYLAVDTPERLAQGGSSILARIPLMLSHVLPVAAGAALLTAFERMRASGALVTLRASGVGWRTILAPAAAAGLAVAGLEAVLSLSAAPAALAAVSERAPSARPSWVLHDGAILRVSADGKVEAWEPGGGQTAAPESAGPIERALDTLSRRRLVVEASTAALVRVARLEERLGHDPRAEWVEVWTRALLPCALVLVLLTCGVSVRREHSAWKGAARLVLAFVAGWLCLAVSTQLFLGGLVPGWAMLALPLIALGVCALL